MYHPGKRSDKSDRSVKLDRGCNDSQRLSKSRTEPLVEYANSRELGVCRAAAHITSVYSTALGSTAGGLLPHFA